MKILAFNWRDINHPEAGGAEVNIHEQARRWAAAGHQVTLFAARPKGHRFRDSIDGITIYRGGGRLTVYMWAIAAYLLFLRKRADVVLDIENGITFLTPLYCFKPKVCLFHHLHQEQFLVEMGPVMGRFGRFLERYAVPVLYRKSVLVAVSHSTARRKREALFRGGRLDIEVIHNGLDHSTYGLGGDKCERPTVLYLGRVKTYKRLPRLIAAMPRVRERVPDVELIIAGKGDAIDEVATAVREHGVEDITRFLGEVSEEQKLDLLRRAWVMATPSMNEGWGVTVIEANACGTPAVAFRVAGLDEAIVDGKTGFLAETDEEFAERIAEVLKEPEIRERLTSGALDWASEFDWDVTAARMLERLERAARQSGRRRWMAGCR